jgi:hypothetical protein
MNNSNQMHSREKDLFVSENIKNFNCGEGWHDLIKSFLSELFDTGWSKSDQVFGKEKFGGLRISIGNNPNELILNISRKYELMSKSVCKLCGSLGSHRVINFWEQTLCTDHFLKNYPVINIKNINLNKVFRVNFEQDYERINLYTRGLLNLGEEKSYAVFHSRQINYYILLKVIPKVKFEDRDRLYIERFFSGLSNCEVCGFKGVFLDSCKYCHTLTWNFNSLRWPNSGYATKLEYVKEMQMDWWLDKDDFRKLKMINETAFEKTPSYQRIFTDEDLSKYIEDQRESDKDV